MEKQAFKLKGTMPALTMLQVLTDEIELIDAQLGEHISQMPQFFLHAPVVLDLEALEDKPFDLARMAALLRERRLVPVAVRNPNEKQKESAIAAGWGILQSALVRPARTPAPPRAEVQHHQQQAPEPPVVGLTVRNPVRSGQVVYAAGGDLVVLAPVSSGAELIADGNIHVYAPFRGRALAGVHDNPDASIFCTNLAAEFLSIAGRHLMADDIPADRRGKAARIHLVDDDLVVSAI
jgi:septum site-determining protein MinC